MSEEPAHQIKPLPPGFQRNMIIVTTLFISLMASIDLTIVTVALPYMAGNLNATSDEVTWVITMFAVGQAIVIGITGHLSRVLGRRVLIQVAVVGFVASSVACGLSQDLDMIVAFRFIQGLFSGPLIPLSQAMLIDAVEEEERAKILAFWVVGVMGGPALGPMLGGYLAQDLDWRWNFWVNVPVGAVALILILTFVRRTPHIAMRTDWLGLGFLIAMLSSLQIALNQGDKLDWFGSQTIVYLLLISFVAALVVAGRGIHLGKRHIINIGLFADLNFTLCCLVVTAMGSTFLAIMIIAPQLFVDGLGWQASTAGLVIGCYGLGGVTGSFIAGRLQSFLSFRISYIMACLIMGSGWYWFSRLDGNLGPWQAVPPGVMIVFGMMLVFPILAARAFANLPPDQRDEGAGLFNLTKTLGFSFGTTAVGTLIYNGNLANWTRYAGDIDPASPALNQYLDALDGVSYDTQMAYVADLLSSQTQLLTIFQIAEHLSFMTFGLALLAVFFGDSAKRKGGSYAGWLDVRPFGRFFKAAGYSGSQ
ncbi:DHA2 family efflux MFS transporter permease subunit [Hoeflea prorocentri]|uniref:DHA2 family efflux MFS transporter permease subunit n=1 Tax=Hoeflea prorocentri TaxID=1922333 RepID=A0A9X3UGL0_9HYPH|nr:DHA2 family efflux MFS transporter permease subunit [Hoeflea prorocentri]MCY6380244.1 DHA2 family efflux MFS transporter permease subunit [Hoeflea prorocentri]MDA5398044.1 DHA2 family efflux MFS transporter permease subunit [Hoeflea prorocentri]